MFVIYPCSVIDLSNSTGLSSFINFIAGIPSNQYCLSGYLQWNSFIVFQSLALESLLSCVFFLALFFFFLFFLLIFLVFLTLLVVSILFSFGSTFFFPPFFFSCRFFYWNFIIIK
eukprot:TRINITY_DN6544_c0_g2_i1.p1 TRINITY_DN6544_c0_g2~~TRINITY_DN6544_c0_g2_i1.p1  ORF type:complete len:115 (-),score=6.42 TRINITY_DN6544_c0_g2_i1:85-429(-)